jgi:hypothetical protein
VTSRSSILLLAASLIGAGIGAATGYLVLQEHKSKGRASAQLSLHAQGIDYVRVGVATFALMRQVSRLFR